MEAFRRRLGGILDGLEVSWMRLGSVLKAKFWFLGSVGRPGRATCRKCDRGLFFGGLGAEAIRFGGGESGLFGGTYQPGHLAATSYIDT